MRLFQIGTFVTLTGLTIAGFQNCARSGSITTSAADAATTEKSMKDLEGQIKTLSARDLTCATNADCVVTPVGAAHCGAPTFLVLTSKISGDYRTVLEMAKTFKNVEGSFMRTNSMVGSCVVLDEPTPTCVANRCVAGS